MSAYVAPIVEGHGELEALPVLLRRIAQAAAVPGGLRVNRPIRVKASSFLHDHPYFMKYVALAGAKAAQEHGSVLILLDCEDDCPAELGPELLERARAVRSDVNILVALAYREFETWYLTAARSLAGLNGLPADLVPPEKPEGIRDAKGWLGDRMDVPYDETTHQPQYADAFDLAAASANASFRRLRACIESLLAPGSPPEGSPAVRGA